MMSINSLPSIYKSTSRALKLGLFISTVTLLVMQPIIQEGSGLASLASSSTRPLSAGNATLGFQNIQVISLPQRYVKEDAIVMQSWASNIEVNIAPGVSPNDLEEKGLPPTSKPGNMTIKEKACARAHANVSTVIQEDQMLGVG
jgi:hypothetical protein